jgi:hypothetical protein
MLKKLNSFGIFALIFTACLILLVIKLLISSDNRLIPYIQLCISIMFFFAGLSMFKERNKFLGIFFLSASLFGVLSSCFQFFLSWNKP